MVTSPPDIPSSLRPGQRRALERLAALVPPLRASGEPSPERRRVQYHAATGSGKTLVARYFAEYLRARVIAFGAPRIDLLGQAFADFRQADARAMDPIVVCSAPEIRETRGFPSGTVVSTSARRLRAALAKPAPADAVRVIFFTYQSAGTFVRALAGNDVLDLLIFDEAHRVASARRAASILWDDGAIHAQVRLALTATPTPAMLSDGVYGVVADRYTVAEGIADQVLCDYRVRVLGVDNAAAAKAIQSEEDQRLVAIADTLLSAMSTGRMRRVLTFHSRRLDAQRFVGVARSLAADRGLDIPLLLAQSGSDRPRARHQALGVLERHGGLIASPRIYLEGTDVRGVDTVVFVDKKTSIIDISQAIGRALRVNPADPAKVAQIVLPVVVPAGESPGEVLQSSDFEIVWEVVRILAAQDPRLAEALMALRAERAGARVDPDGGGVAAADDPRGEPLAATMELTGTPVSHLVIEGALQGLARGVVLRAVDAVGDRRAMDVAMLTAFAYRTGTTRVAPGFVLEDGYPLGQRVARLRSAYRAGRLPRDLVEALEALPTWVAETGPRDRLATLWPNLQAYQATHGHAMVPAEHTGADGDAAFGRQVDEVRSLYRAGTLSERDRRQCEALVGWVWDLNAPSLYHQAVPMLREFVVQHGHARVPSVEDWPTSIAGAHVATVVAALRAAYQSKSLPAADAHAIEREFALSWTPPRPTLAFKRRLAGMSPVLPFDRFAAAWGAGTTDPHAIDDA